MLALQIMGYRIINYCLIFCGAFVLWVASAAGDVYVNGQLGGVQNIGGETINIGPNGGYVGGTVNITGDVDIINGGTITSTLNINDQSPGVGSKVRIENYGTYNAPANFLGSESTITQVIKTPQGITSLANIGVGYDVLVTDTTDILNWNDIAVNTMGGATKYTFSNASIRMNNITTINNVALKQDVFVYIDNIQASDVILFNGVSGTGGLYVIPGNQDDLHSVDTYLLNGNIYLRVIRSTDYARILNNNTGIFLNSLRQVAPDDALLAQLDAAETLDDFNRIMSKSVKLHPVNMMKSIKTMYSHKMLETMHIAHDDGLGIKPMVIFSDDMFAIGGEPYVNVNVLDNLHLKIHANISNLKYSDDINSYSAMSYGVGADAVYDLSVNNYVRAYGGFNLSTFDAGLVFDGNGATEKPNGFSGYVIGEFGHRFNFNDKYYISPFVMIGGDYATILNSDDVDYYAGVGGDIGFNFEIDGFRYDYATRGMVRSDGGLGIDINASIWSLADSAGGGLRGGVFYVDELGVSYHIGLDAKFNF